MIQRLLVAIFGVAVLVGLAEAGSAQETSTKQTAPDGERDSSSKKSDQPAQPEPSSDAAPGDSSQTTKKKKLEKATFGGGCFWCMEAVFERIPGVKNVESGYSGGHVPNPTYQMVCTGLTGHAEVIQIEFDPAVLSFEKLLSFFWIAHDPTTPNSQGPDFGPQYRSIILYHGDEQKAAAIKSYREQKTLRKNKSPIVTELVPFVAFYPADEHHQDYYRNNPYSDYSQTYIEPKVNKLRKKLH